MWLMLGLALTLGVVWWTGNLQYLATGVLCVGMAWAFGWWALALGLVPIGSELHLALEKRRARANAALAQLARQPQPSAEVLQAARAHDAHMASASQA